MGMLGNHRKGLNSSEVGRQRLYRKSDTGAAPGKLSGVPQGAEGGGVAAEETTS